MAVWRAQTVQSVPNAERPVCSSESVKSKVLAAECWSSVLKIVLDSKHRLNPKTGFQTTAQCKEEGKLNYFFYAFYSKL